MYYLKFEQESIAITKSTNPHESIFINYNSLQITKQHIKTIKSPYTQFSSLLGMKTLKTFHLLLVATQIQQKGTIGLSPLNQIKKVGWIAIAPQVDQVSILSSLQNQLQQINSIFNNGLHYYSDLYDLTHPYIYNKLQPATSIINHHYQQFHWNYNLANMDGFSTHGSQIFYNYCHKIIQGYLTEFITVKPNGNQLKYVLISRRSNKKAGTRFYDRGINDQGHVANFVQTEQIVFDQQRVFTHLQIRGSVPAFFCQTGINGIADDLIIQRSQVLTKTAFLKHFNQLKSAYSRILSVNLLSEKKEQQNKLSTFYESMVDKNILQQPFHRYQYYDFHQSCKGNKFQNSEELIEKLSKIVLSFGYNCYNKTSGRFQALQTGVFRTNCLDCLDRTNYVQSRLALKTLSSFFSTFGDSQTKHAVANKQWLHMPTSFEFIGFFNNAWANNGDSISILYTGIESTHTDITRTGERTLFGSIHHKYKSLMRFVQQFSDHKKQNSINQLTNPSSPNVKNNLSHQFRAALYFSLELGEQNNNLNEVKHKIFNYKPMVIVILLYENQQSQSNGFFSKISNLFKSNRSFIQLIKQKCDKLIQQGGYTLLTSLDAQSSSILAYCRNDCLAIIGDIKCQNNSKKGRQALLIKMRIQHSYFIFCGVNCKQLDQFLQLFDQIHDKGFQQSKLGVFKSKSLFEVEYRVVFGMTGSKLQMNEEQKNSLAIAFKSMGKNIGKNHLMTKILDADQLSLDYYIYKSKYFRLYNEGSLLFVPQGNRLFFWNQEGFTLRLRTYESIGDKGIMALIDYEVDKRIHGQS